MNKEIKGAKNFSRLVVEEILFWPGEVFFLDFDNLENTKGSV